MKIAVAVKLVPDDQDIQVGSDRSLNYDKAKPVVSTYDLNAVEAAVQTAAAQSGSVTAIAAGPASINDSKQVKNILARGCDELLMVADDACAGMDARQTAAVLAGLVQKAGADLVLCGDGSADMYTQQVDVQLACALGWPVVNAASKIEVADGAATVTRTLEDDIETVQVALPAVISVTPDCAMTRIPGMKDILAAGKKPKDITAADAVPASTIEEVECLAPLSADRKCEVVDAGADDAIANFAAALKAAL